MRTTSTSNRQSSLKPDGAIKDLYKYLRSIKVPKVKTKMDYIQEVYKLKREIHIKTRELLREINKGDLMYEFKDEH